METGDLSPHHLAHRQERANSLLQQELLTNELFGPATEDVAAGFADGFSRFPRAIEIDVEDPDDRAFLRETHRDRPADAAAAARD